MRTLSRRPLHALCILLLSSLLAACSTVSRAPAPAMAADAQWVLLPFVNHTETPQAGLRAEAIAESLLRAQGVTRLKRYPGELNTETLFEPMDRKRAEAARNWAKSAGARYALTGSVDEWRYKVGIDGEPAVGITLQLIDLQQDQVIWSATGGRTGWSREALSAVAHKLLANLLDPL